MCSDSLALACGLKISGPPSTLLSIQRPHLSICPSFHPVQGVRMLACTEMITMCLQSAKQQHLSKQLQQECDYNHNRTASLFHDIFRRADKNDDGKLSLEEFQSYFNDGVLTDEQMQELYRSIDRQNADNMDIDKLSEYFSPHVGEYINVLSALEKLNVAILKAMDKTKEEYQGSSVLGQFVTRFLLRETSTQLQSLQSSLDCAMEAVHDQGCTNRRSVKKPEDLPIQRVSKRPARRIQKNMCLSPTDPYSGMLTTGVSVESDYHWGSQVDQLEQLIDKLECESPHLEPLKEDTLAGTYKSNILLVQRQMSVKECDVERFQNALKIYTESSSGQQNNLHISVQNLPDRSCFIMYEFWQDRLSWMSFLQSPISKSFQRCIIDSLEEQEIVSTMLLPASWWIMNNN
ncbi:N-terminal EF-hand calcium-binding protein 1-like [Syngnathus typhle]|uniref:N-terminal EF-hand calcium-binding protein 1-like n=1 Tax=Syngnathus typhle TaxID=161592 RepID=UPI002A6AE0ED|nr:N-terminal EF-hand calcium-binding protein 1-like [Syngnathus typhle]